MVISTTPPNLPFGHAICYSGYRVGQSPVTQVYPSDAEIIADLRLLAPHWHYLRLYDCSQHAERVLQAVRAEGLAFQIMLGADLEAEQNNPHCPWGAEYSDATLAANQVANDAHIDRLIELAQANPNSVCALSIGNEASVDWGDRLVPVKRLLSFVARIKASGVKQPITFCENYVPWVGKLEALADRLDIISIHTYPIWEYKSIDEALDYTEQNYQSVAQYYPDKPVIITEAGWATRSNGRGIKPDNASQALQAEYCRQLLRWSQDQQILTFLFEAFDEPWKGSDDPDEPEKHWGLYTVDRTPKAVVQAMHL